MNWFDIFIVIVLLRTSYIGFKNGLSTEIYKTGSLVFSGSAAFYFYKKLISFISQYTVIGISDNILNIISFLIILIICLLLFKFIFVLIQKITQVSFAKKFNTMIGMVFGLFRGIFISCIIFIILNWSSVDYIKDSIREKSFSGKYIVIVNSHFKDIFVKFFPG